MIFSSLSGVATQGQKRRPALYFCLPRSRLDNAILLFFQDPSTALPRFIIRSVTWIYSTILLRISSGSLSNLALLLSCLVPLSKERRSRGSIYENERYKGVHRGYLPLRRIIMASSADISVWWWIILLGGREKKRKEIIAWYPFASRWYGLKRDSFKLEIEWRTGKEKCRKW